MTWSTTRANKTRHLACAVVALSLLACGSNDNGTTEPGTGGSAQTGGSGGADGTAGTGGSAGPSITPVYVTFAGHIEDEPPYDQCPVYELKRGKLLQFAGLVHDGGAAFNLQIDYPFFKGAQDCETPTLMASTDGKNVVHYLATNYGFEIDAHQEGGWDWADSPDNYADVRYIGGKVTDRMSENVGGIVWDYALQLPELEAGQKGVLHPGFTWLPETVLMAVGYKHHGGDFGDDDDSSGVWVPAGTNDDFYQHDPNKRLVNISGGPHGNWGGGPNCVFQNVVDYVEVLVDYLERGVIEGGKMYTATIAIPQSVMFDSTKHHKVSALLTQIEPLVADGRVVLANFSEVVQIWRTSYGSNPNIFRFENVDQADYTCP